MKSIMHDKTDHTCYLCMIQNQDYATRTGLQEHHVIFGTAGRKKAEQYGLKVYLCMQHHMMVHKDHQMAEILKKDAQEKFEKRYSREEWMRIFGRNYL